MPIIVKETAGNAVFQQYNDLHINHSYFKSNHFNIHAYKYIKFVYICIVMIQFIGFAVEHMNYIFSRIH